jgi:hypothetical protein
MKLILCAAAMAAATAMCTDACPFSFFDKGSDQYILVDDFHSENV